MLFHKTKDKPQNKTLMLSVIAQDNHILGSLVSGGSIDFDGTIDGNIRCHTLTVRKHGSIKGDVTSDILHVYGKIDGIIRAKHVHLYTDSHVEGVIMHETLIIEDGAFVDGKCKRTDKNNGHDSEPSELSVEIPVTSSIRLIN